MEAKRWQTFYALVLLVPILVELYLAAEIFEPDKRLSDNLHIMSAGDIKTLNSLYPKKYDNFCSETICPINDFEKINYNLCFDPKIASQCRDYCGNFIRQTCTNDRGTYYRGYKSCGHCVLKETTVTPDIKIKKKIN